VVENKIINTKKKGKETTASAQVADLVFPAE